MIAVDREDERVGKFDLFEMGRVEVNTERVIAVNRAARVHDGTMTVSR